MRLLLNKSKATTEVRIKSFRQTMRTTKGKLTLDKDIEIGNIIGFDYTMNFSFQ